LSNREPEPQYPIRSLHDFLADVERELIKFRRMSILGAIASLIIIVTLGRFIFVLFHFSGRIPRMPPIYPGQMFPLDLILTILALACLLYSIYALLGQSAFLKRWDKRFKEIHTLEQKLLE